MACLPFWRGSSLRPPLTTLLPSCGSTLALWQAMLQRGVLRLVDGDGGGSNTTLGKAGSTWHLALQADVAEVTNWWVVLSSCGMARVTRVASCVTCDVCLILYHTMTVCCPLLLLLSLLLLSLLLLLLYAACFNNLAIHPSIHLVDRSNDSHLLHLLHLLRGNSHKSITMHTTQATSESI